MTDTSTADELPPQTNGINNGILDEDEQERMRIRPVEIDADVREMERRKRVENIMNSRLFREELERIIETQMRDGSGASATGLLQQISDMVGVSKQAGNVFKNSNCVIPINDIRGIESMGYAKGEKILRCKLAAVFRLIDLYGWTQSPSALITARLNQEDEQFLVNPYGMLFHEVTASSLIKVDMQGAVLEQGTTNFSVNVTAFSLHAAVHAARPDLRCIIHVRTPSVVAVSALKHGLLPLSQESVVVGEASIHVYLAGLLDADEKDKLARNLGPVNKVLLLTNQGALCCGETMEEAFFNARNTILASETQLKLLPVGIDNLILLNDEARKKIYDTAHRAPESTPRPDQPSVLEGKVERKWRVGGVEFEALMRMMDNAGFRTGYIYRHPLVKGEPPKPRNDVEVPPAVSSLGYLLEEEELYRQGLWRKLEGGRKGNDRSRWLNSPNVYQKVEVLETGTPDPKKITKWVAEASPSHSSTPMKIDAALQFVPQGTNPKEFKQRQQQIKDYRRADKISAGPQSHILEGVTWEEARKMQDAVVTQTGDQVVLMGAASKGIIQRGHQHNATVYKSPYAKNPFDCVTDEELEDYKKVVEKKTKGEYDTDYSESEGLSSAQINKQLDNLHLRSPTSMTSETEEESRDEPRILRIETTTAPKPSQPEVVLSDAEHPVEQFLRTERRPVNNYRSSETLTNNFYRTNSHAGLPKGSYLSPNPLHFHISRLTTTEEVQIKRPLIITNKVFRERLAHANKITSHILKDNVNILLRFNNSHSAAMDMPLSTLRGFILPFAKALNEMPVVHNISSQTSYNINENVNYSPLYRNAHSNTLHVDSSDKIEQNVLKNLHDSIMAETLCSEEDVNEMYEFDDNDRADICEGLAEIPIDIAENFNFNDAANGKTLDLCVENFLKIINEFCISLDSSSSSESVTEDLKDNDEIYDEIPAVEDGSSDNVIGKLDENADNMQGKSNVMHPEENPYFEISNNQEIILAGGTSAEVSSSILHHYGASSNKHLTNEENEGLGGEDKGNNPPKEKANTFEQNKELPLKGVPNKIFESSAEIYQEDLLDEENNPPKEITNTFEQNKVLLLEVVPNNIFESSAEIYKEDLLDEENNSPKEKADTFEQNKVLPLEVVPDKIYESSAEFHQEDLLDEENNPPKKKVDAFEQNKEFPLRGIPDKIYESSAEMCLEALPDAEVSELADWFKNNSHLTMLTHEGEERCHEYDYLQSEIVLNINLSSIPEEVEELDVTEKQLVAEVDFNDNKSNEKSVQIGIKKDDFSKKTSEELAAGLDSENDSDDSISSVRTYTIAEAQEAEVKHSDSSPELKPIVMSSTELDSNVPHPKISENLPFFKENKELGRNYEPDDSPPKPNHALSKAEENKEFSTELVTGLNTNEPDHSPPKPDHALSKDDLSTEIPDELAAGLDIGNVSDDTISSARTYTIAGVQQAEEKHLKSSSELKPLGISSTALDPNVPHPNISENLPFMKENKELGRNYKPDDSPPKPDRALYKANDNNEFSTQLVTDLNANEPDHSPPKPDHVLCKDDFSKEIPDELAAGLDFRNVSDDSISSARTYTIAAAQQTEEKHLKSSPELKPLGMSSTELDPNVPYAKFSENLPFIKLGRHYQPDDSPPKPDHALSKDNGNKEFPTKLAADLNANELDHSSPKSDHASSKDNENKEYLTELATDLNTKVLFNETSTTSKNKKSDENEKETSPAKSPPNQKQISSTIFVEHLMTEELGEENLDNNSPNEMVMQHKEHDSLIIPGKDKENDLQSHLVIDNYKEDIIMPEETKHSTTPTTCKNIDNRAAHTIKEVRRVLTYLSESVDKGIADASISSAAPQIDDRVKQLGTIIRDYVVEEGFEIEEMVVFPELPDDSHLSKLILQLLKTFTASFPDWLSPDQRSDLRLAISNYVIDLLNVDPRFDDSGSSDNTLNISDKVFTISEYVSEILNVFFGEIYSDHGFFMFSKQVSEDMIAQSTPSAKRSINQVESDYVHNCITTFKKKSTKASESLWISITSDKPSPIAKPQTKTIVNVDEIPLRPPPDLDPNPSTSNVRVNLFNSDLSESFTIGNNSDEDGNTIAGYEILSVINLSDCDRKKKDDKKEQSEPPSSTTRDNVRVNLFNSDLSGCLTIGSETGNSIADYEILGVISISDSESEKEDEKKEELEPPSSIMKDDVRVNLFNSNLSKECFPIGSNKDETGNKIADYEILGSSDSESEKTEELEQPSSTMKENVCVNLFNSNLPECFPIGSNKVETGNTIADYEILGSIDFEDDKKEQLKPSNINIVASTEIHFCRTKSFNTEKVVFATDVVFTRQDNKENLTPEDDGGDWLLEAKF
ncbi:unnamed protein product [Ceutorhynchus assimilis]|uniref:Class II aldolase/adducin N-terminal domain-containing protein n=1 Tax=Ceutorhynchus assimilis TaxID=467358 RepID=A0A9N9MJH4_9CUCU|nr:unnamed protein product [Ceutorhynchus assimilis]